MAKPKDAMSKRSTQIDQAVRLLSAADLAHARVMIEADSICHLCIAIIAKVRRNYRELDVRI